MYKDLILRAATVAASLAATSCAGTLQERATHTTFAIPFSLNLNDIVVGCGATYQNVGSTSADMSLQDARLYVSNFRLLDTGGGETPLLLEQDGVWQSKDLALLDFENATGACNGNPVTNTVVRGSATPGDYVGLAFDIGVPERLNHQDPTLASPPLNLSALTWPWRNGYKYTTFDLETTITSGAVEGAPGFSIHLGAMQCGDGSPVRPPSISCTEQNRPAIRLANFDPSADTVVLDLAALLAETDLTTNEPETPSGCMSASDDTDCDGIFRRAGLRDAAQSFVRSEPTQALARNE